MSLALHIVRRQALFTRGQNILRNAVSFCLLIYNSTNSAPDCGAALAPGGVAAAAGDCNMACTGNSSEACGGPSRLNMFWSGTTGPQTNPGVGLWKFAGCYT